MQIILLLSLCKSRCKPGELLFTVVGALQSLPLTKCTLHWIITQARVANIPEVTKECSCMSLTAIIYCNLTFPLAFLSRSITFVIRELTRYVQRDEIIFRESLHLTENFVQFAKSFFLVLDSFQIFQQKLSTCQAFHVNSLKHLKFTVKIFFWLFETYFPARNFKHSCDPKWL